jgi:uracil-DNA glycosylase
MMHILHAACTTRRGFMETYDREHRIKSIIKLEERVGLCKRCSALVKCTNKPSLGRGDLEPQVLLVFECESACTRNNDWIIQLRNSIKQHFHVDRVYHTYLVRCQPKACPSTHGLGCCLTTRLLDRNNACLLTNQFCTGIPIKPNDEEILNCLTYLVEEITILQPAYVMLLGRRVSDFVLKTLGRFEADADMPSFFYEDTIFLPAAAADTFQDAEVQRLASLIKGW